MISTDLQQDLVLGEIDGRALRISSAALQASYAQARSIAAALGSRHPETSMESYWSLAARVGQWQVLVDRIGLARARGALIVEIGSGMGLFTLTGRALGFRVVGLDSSSDRYMSRMQIAQTIFGDNEMAPTLVQSVSEQLPFASASVDVVASFQTIEHVADVEATLRDIRRILKPGGVFFAQVPNYMSFQEAHYGVFAPLGLGKPAFRRYLNARRKPTQFLEHLQWLTPPKLRELLKTAGFATCSVAEYSRPTYVSGRLPAEVAPLPFQWRRGALTFRAAYRLAMTLDALGAGGDYYPQVEIWATA
jgi:ubiquinone/menaquinone biosynthesis C-methylase UbiE